jgi:GNAT superfamily N-acetyltransferase
MSTFAVIMDIKLTKIKNSLEREKAKSLYLKAFPAYERLPFFLIYRKRKKQDVAFYSIYDGEMWIGLVYCMIYNDLLYVCYFAIDGTIRSKGYGGAVMSKIKEMYAGRRIFLAIETLNEKAENHEQRVKRRRFYEKYGFKSAGCGIGDGVQSFEFLYLGECFHIEEYIALMKKYDWLVGVLFEWFFRKKIRKFAPDEIAKPTQIQA